MRKLKRRQWFKEVLATGSRLLDSRAWSAAAIGLLVFSGFMAVQVGNPDSLSPATAIAANGESDHPAEIARAAPVDGSTINIDNNPYVTENAGQSWSLSSPEADTFRFELRHGDHWSSSYWSDPGNSERDEIAGRTVYPSGTQINIAYDFMVEPGQTNSASGPGRWLVLGQMHEHNVPDSPPFAVELVNGDHMAIDIGTHNLMYVYIDPNPIQRGHFYSMNIQVVFASNGNGFLQVWRDGINIVDYHGSIGTGVGTYWKQGIYRASAAESIAVHFRRLKITAAAIVTGISASLVNGPNGSGTTAAVTLQMSKEVTVTGTPILILSDGGTAVYTGGSGTNALIFGLPQATGEANDSTPEIAGIGLPDGATVKDALGAAANLSIASIARSDLQFHKLANGNESRHANP
jgi:Polysaccharide lyase